MTLFSIETLRGLGWLIPMFVIHELGHYWRAKKYGIYKGLNFFLGGMAVEMTNYLPSRWEYLWGIAFSFLAFPLFLLLKDPKVAIWYYPIFALAIGVVDIIVFIFYTPIVRNIEKQRAEQKKTIPKLGVCPNMLYAHQSGKRL